MKNNIKSEYDDIAKQYSENNEKSIGANYLWYHTFFQVLGDVKNISVLDLACGDGYLARNIKLKGASEVFGIDLSKKMLKIAKDKEKKFPLGINYQLGKVGKLKKINEFDVVVAGFLLHYSKEKGELLRMCQDVYKNLKVGGRFVTINKNPEIPLSLEKQYGSTHTAKGRITDGSKVKVTFYDNKKEVCSFYNYHWSKKIYEDTLKKVGFRRIKWVPLKVSKEGVKKMGKVFWNNWYKNNHLVVMEAIK